MIRTIAFLCFAIAAPAMGGSMDKDLRVRFDINPLSKLFNKSFMQQPQSIDSAKEAGWVYVTRAIGPEGFASLVMLCPKNDYTVCLLFDNTGYVCGLQIALDVKQVTDNKYDWKSQGFSNWTTDNEGKTENYFVTTVYFCSPEYLAMDAEARIAARNPKKLLQDKFIYVTGFNGELYPISTNVTEITNPETSVFTKQACTPLMGNHYYYKMTKDLECHALTLFPYFVLVYKGQMVGIGFVNYLKIAIKDGCTDYFEYPPKWAVKLIVPRGPQCMYDLAESPGRITMHVYFIHNPLVLTCLD